MTCRRVPGDLAGSSARPTRQGRTCGPLQRGCSRVPSWEVFRNQCPWLVSQEQAQNLRARKRPGRVVWKTVRSGRPGMRFVLLRSCFPRSYYARYNRHLQPVRHKSRPRFSLTPAPHGTCAQKKCGYLPRSKCACMLSRLLVGSPGLCWRGCLFCPLAPSAAAVFSRDVPSGAFYAPNRQ